MAHSTVSDPLRQHYRFSAALLVLVAWPSHLLVAQCGGDERWAVKVAADTGAANIDPQNRTITTLHDLTIRTRPTIPADEVTRTAAERTVWVIDAFLVQFKQETGKSGDADLHLVISDSTGEFSSGKAHSVANPHSIIAEIPNPDCVGGRNGTVAGQSHFQASLDAVRARFMQQFPHITSGWNDGGRIAVRLTGIGFYDKQHGQVGRALNGLELHPLLDIEFNPSTPPTATTQPIAALVPVVNGDFEMGDQGWTGSDSVITSAGSGEPRAHSGHWRAWLGGYGETHTNTLLSDVIVLPTTSPSLVLTFYLHIESEEEAAGAYDKMFLRVRAEDGTLLKSLKTYSNEDAASGWAKQSFDLTPFAGRSIRIELEAREDARLTTSFVVDDFAVASGS